MTTDQLWKKLQTTSDQLGAVHAQLRTCKSPSEHDALKTSRQKLEEELAWIEHELDKRTTAHA